MTLTTERPTSNEDRMQVWEESLRRQGSGDCASSSGGAAFSTEDLNGHDDEEAWWQACLGMIGLIVVLFTMIVVTALIVGPAPEPEERCFTNAIGETYCREQQTWEVE